MELISTFAEAADEDLLDLFFGFIKSSLLVLLTNFCSCYDSKPQLLVEPSLLIPVYIFFTEQQQFL